MPPIATAQPQLELELRGEPQAAAGGQMQLEMIIRNVGNAPATQVTLLDRLDAGLDVPAQPRLPRNRLHGRRHGAAGRDEDATS